MRTCGRPLDGRGGAGNKDVELCLIDLIHDVRHVGFAIIMQISYTLLRGQTTQVREVITNTLATQMIYFTFIECLSPK